jgi:hypothetical protein
MGPAHPVHGMSWILMPMPGLSEQQNIRLIRSFALSFSIMEKKRRKKGRGNPFLVPKLVDAKTHPSYSPALSFINKNTKQ